MSDARWTEVDDDVRSAVHHFSMAVTLHERLVPHEDEVDRYREGMAFMHAMESGHTSFENAMTRILGMLQEEKPSGESWHKDLVDRVSRALEDRPAVLDPETSRAAQETRAFRNLATRGYDTFSNEKCEPAVAAARFLVGALPAAVANFRRLVDPAPSAPNSKKDDGTSSSV